MTESTASNGTVFHTHRLSNGLQIVAQPMPDFEACKLLPSQCPISSRLPYPTTCAPARVMSLTSVSQASPISWSTWSLRAQKRWIGKR